MKHAQIGPQTSLTEDCEVHPGQKVVFKDDQIALCEKCYPEKAVKTRASKESKQEADGGDDLISRL